MLTSITSSTRPACKWIFCSTRATTTLLWSIIGSLDTSFISALCTNITFYIWRAGWTTLYLINLKIDTNIADTYSGSNSKCIAKLVLECMYSGINRLSYFFSNKLLFNKSIWHLLKLVYYWHVLEKNEISSKVIGDVLKLRYNVS